MGLSDADLMLDEVTDRGTIKLDPRGKVVRWSSGAQTLFGYSEAEVLGRPVSMLHIDEDLAVGLAESELVDAQQSDRVEFEGWRGAKHAGRNTVTTL